MKTKLFCLLTFSMFSLGMKAQNISIPDANFKAKLLSSSPGNTVAKNLSGNYFAIDTNGDGQIQTSEASQVGSLEIVDISGNNIIQNYQGILSFTNIKNIKVNHYYSPTSPFNISNLNSLEDVNISFQGSSGNSSVLSVADCSNLKSITTKGIVFQNITNTPVLKNIDALLYENSNLAILDDLTNLSNLEKVTLTGFTGTYSSGVTAGTLNLSNHQYLKEVDINYVKLSTLNLSHCNVLDTVNLHMGNTPPNMSPNYFGTLDVSFCPSFTHIALAGDSNVAVLNANNCLNLQSIDSDSEYLSSFNASNSPLLNEIDLMSLTESSLANPFQMANCPGLKTISITKYGNSSFNATDAVNLEHLYLGSPSYYPGYNTNFFGPLQNLTISNNLQLKTLGLSNHKITQLNINGLPMLQSVAVDVAYSSNTNVTPQPDFSTEFLQSVNIQNCPSLTNVGFAGQKGLKNLTIKNCASLASIEHSSSNNSNPEIGDLKTVDIEDCAALSTVNVSYNQVDNFTLKNTGVHTIDVSRNELTNFDLLSNNTNLTKIDASRNKFTTINLSDLPVNLVTLDHSFNLLNSIAGTSSTVKNLSIFSNNLTDFNIHNLPNLDSLIMGRNKIVDVDFSGHSKIRAVYEIDYNSFWGNPSFPNPNTFTKTFNVNNCTNLQTLLLESSSLERVFAKNGVNENIIFQMGNYPNLQYICCDASQITDLTALLAMDGIVCSINDYCNFAPGGNYNTITGTVKFDDNNNGCDGNDAAFEHMKLKISNGTTTEETFVKSSGEYNLYTQGGTFTITAEPENPSLFTATPSTFTTTFANADHNVSTQNICVTKNGNIKDLEVVFAPVTDARPGFNAIYKLIWRNKGNTTLSGNVAVTFNNSKLNFLSSALPSSVAGNQITFNFTNLKPYQNTASEMTFTVNPPTHATNPAHIGDILNFSSVITPLSGDIHQDDNQFVYNQTVIGSYDPNDIICLEGNSIPLSMVGKYLHYMINFENTGTAPATNIVVEMEINPEDFDLSTLQLQNTSHTSFTKINGNKVEFMMKDINLAAGAHGNIALKIKSKNNLASGDSVSNKANIYFDYNFPVETNDAVTNIESSTLSAVEINKEKTSVSIYPNPTKGEVNITADSEIKSVEIYDAQGRIIQKQVDINSDNTNINIHSPISGVYYFKIITEKESFVKKVIKI